MIVPLAEQSTAMEPWSKVDNQVLLSQRKATPVIVLEASGVPLVLDPMIKLNMTCRTKAKKVQK